MPELLAASVPFPEFAFSVPARIPPMTRAGETGPCRDFDVIVEMLQTMDTLTASGQRHTMHKIVGFLRARVERATLSASPRNQRTLAGLTETLSRTSERIWPDAKDFASRAENLISLLRQLS